MEQQLLQWAAEKREEYLLHKDRAKSNNNVELQCWYAGKLHAMELLRLHIGRLQQQESST